MQQHFQKKKKPNTPTACYEELRPLLNKEGQFLKRLQQLVQVMPLEVSCIGCGVRDGVGSLVGNGVPLLWEAVQPQIARRIYIYISYNTSTESLSFSNKVQK
eukprot:Tbor_TRINITY_DN6200_c0_g1::TRINITY_DN6200_c0_g1_i3::g.1817::m.1817